MQSAVDERATYEMLKTRNILIALGVICFVFAVQQYTVGNDSMYWGSTDGVISLSTVRITSTATEHSSKVYEPLIEYVFRSEGKEQKGNRISFGHKSFSKKGLVYRIIEKYPVGKKVTVYHELRNPDNSVLERGIDSVFIYMLVSTGVFCVLVGVYLDTIIQYFTKWLLP